MKSIVVYVAWRRSSGPLFSSEKVREIFSDGKSFFFFFWMGNPSGTQAAESSVQGLGDGERRLLFLLWLVLELNGFYKGHPILALALDRWLISGRY